VVNEPNNLIFAKMDETMKYLKLFLLLIILAIFGQQANATIIHVPGDSSTIQAAVNGAVHGDTILVAPGVYNENVVCSCRAILLTSDYLFDHDSLTINSTIIDGSGGDALFLSGGNCFPEDESLTVIGFTIRNSTNGVWKELADWYAEPRSKSRICHNRFIGNSWGIFTLTWDFCVIDHNIFINNMFGAQCWGGLSLMTKIPQPPPRMTIVENNVFLFNSEIGADAVGGAIAIFRDNVFSHNRWGMAKGYNSGLAAVRNIVYNNEIGVYCEALGSVWEDLGIFLENNIIAKNDTGIFIYGSGMQDTIIRYNDVWGNFYGNFIGCPAGVGDTTWGTNFNGTPCDSFYNITKDPLFADTIDFEPPCNSPCIDAGDSGAPVPESGGCRIDIGKNEFSYIIGDVNSDFVIDIVDVVFVINYLFVEGPAPCPYHSSDTNCDGIVDVQDIVCWINFLFCGSTFPCFKR
jgi:nitrous oxidase accessory protein NosD